MVIYASHMTAVTDLIVESRVVKTETRFFMFSIVEGSYQMIKKLSSKNMHRFEFLKGRDMYKC